MTQLLQKMLDPKDLIRLKAAAREDGMTMREILQAAISDYVGYRDFQIAGGSDLYAHVQK